MIELLENVKKNTILLYICFYVIIKKREIMSKIKMFFVGGVEKWFKKNNANFKSKKSARLNYTEIVNILEEKLSDFNGKAVLKPFEILNVRFY